jgi:hypothetical protein
MDARRSRLGLGALFLVAAAQRAWNAWAIAPLSGYDGPAHAAYMLTILLDHRLPHPLEGWSTFHPPLYYLAGSVVWAAVEPLGPRAVLAAIRALGALLGLAAAVVAWVLVRRLGGDRTTALVATALVLFVPCVQIAATMEGNEAFAAGVTALGLPALLRLHVAPRDRRAAAAFGAAAGLALISKFSSVSLVAAALVPFVRRDFDRAMAGSLAVVAGLVVLLAGPVYARNVWLTGSPVPMTRTREPMYTVERSQIIRPRRAGDYVRLDAGALLRPSLFHVPGLPARYRNRNRAMASVPGLTYASIWWDAFAHRIPIGQHRDGVWSGPFLAHLGLVPSLTVALGFAAATLAAARTRLRDPAAPLVVMTCAALAAFVAFTWAAPSAAAVKGSYLLPLAPAAAVFFARGIGMLGPRLRAAVLALSLAAAVAAAVIFTEGVLFRSVSPAAHMWAAWARRLPGSHIADVIALFLPR